MRPRTLAEMAAGIGGAVRKGGRDAGEDAAGGTVTGVTIDSRTVRPGDLFVALPGARANGHAFVQDALAAGAVAAMVQRQHARPATTGPLIEVDDPGAALLSLARDERSRLRATVIGVTGSTGKTCTKDFIAAVLAQRLRVVASEASFNNEVGLPLTLLRASDDTEAVVCEMGSRGRGHIRLLCDVARPRIGIVTNVGQAHMELFGSPEALRDAKAELPEALPPDGTAVLNADDPVVRSFAGRTRARVVSFGTNPGSDVRADRITFDDRTGRAGFDLLTPGGTVQVELPVAGHHMVPNALAATAVGWALGLSTEECAAGLAGASVAPGRMELAETPEGIRILDDTYNANPTSVAAALKAARWMARTGRCVAVLGHMAELGPIADLEHERVGELVARLGIDELVVVGSEAGLIAVGAEREGVEPERIHRCQDASEATHVVRTMMRPGDLVLIKASRVARLERIALALTTGQPVEPVAPAPGPRAGDRNGAAA